MSTTLTKTAAKIKQDLGVIDFTYNVGDIYETIDTSMTSETLNDIFGGTWEQDLPGKWYDFYKFPTTTLNSSTTSVSHSTTLATRGGPVFLCLTGDNNPGAQESTWIRIRFYRDNTEIAREICQSNVQSQNIPFALRYLDRPGSGSHTYQAVIERGNGTIQLGESGATQTPQFIAFELNDANNPYIKFRRTA